LLDDHVRRPDIIVVDVAAPGGLETIASLRGRTSGIPVIALGVGTGSSDIIVCAEAGAAGYVSEDASLDELVEAIDDVLSGRLACPPTIAFDLFQTIGTARSTQRPDGAELTPREQQVLQLLSRGQSNKEIARSLGIAVSTVKNHVHHILEKSEACSRKHAALKSPFMLASDGHGGRQDLVPSLLPI
jgi:DNA-binding NarL/FixJ family response regulator